MKYSKEVLDWFDNFRKRITNRIESFEELPDSEKSKYESISDYFDWPPEDKKEEGFPGAIEYDVDDFWDELKPKYRKEIGSKADAAYQVALILRDEFNIDIVEAVKRNGQPCYGIHDQIRDYDWEEDEEKGYKKLARFIANKNLDRGSALELYWGFCPEHYTQFLSVSDITDRYKKTAFQLLKKLETRLLDNKFKTNIIPYEPSPGEKRDNGKWDIPEELKKPNL